MRMIRVHNTVWLLLAGLAGMLALASCSSGATYTPPGASGSVTATTPAPAPTLKPGAPPWPVTSWHYAPNDNFNRSGEYTPGAIGFNLADINAYSKGQLDGLPAGVHGLVYIGTCDGVTAAFQAAVDSFAGDPKLFGFYITDEPTPKHCPAKNLLAEDNYIHAHAPGAKTFAILENLGKSAVPTFTGAYTPQDCGLDLIGIDPYPVRSEVLGTPRYEMIAQYVHAVEAWGWPASSIVPVYQTFGRSYPDDANGFWVLPNAEQERQMLAYWAAVIPHPAFDYAYSWGAQFGDDALIESPSLQAVFAEKNKSSS
jgi:hypothetical protein